MKTLTKFKAPWLLALLLSAVSVAQAIKIEIPKQYEAQLETLKTEEFAEVQEALARGSEADEAVADGASVKAIEEASGEVESGDGSQHFLLESVEEATATAAAFTGELPAGHGLVSGQVVDKETGVPVVGAAIILEGTDIGTITDSEGRYSIGPAPEGMYTISFIKSGYIEANVTEFTVTSDEVSVFPFAMPPRPAEMSDDVYELQDFTVTAEKANDLMMKLDLKFDSSRALDVFSSEDFSKFSASDVADAVKRIAGVSVTDGKFPSVRGLNDRYTVTTLNGMPLPSPDPFRKSPQFDIFPSSLLDSIVVSKSATADLDGESTAANFDLLTKQLPEEFFLTVSLGTGWHSGSIEDFRSFDKSDGYLLADGAGSINQAPRTDPLQGPADDSFSRSDDLNSHEKDAGPNTSISLAVGNTFELSNGRKLGVVFAGYHKRDTSAILDAVDNQGYDFAGADRFETTQITLPFPPFPTIDVDQNVNIPFGDETRYDYEEYEESVKLGGLLGLSYSLDEDHQFFANVFTSRTNDLVVKRNYNGVNSGENITPEEDLFLLRERLYFVERSLTIGQLGGEHTFATLPTEPKFSWGLQRANTVQDEPDFRDTTTLLRYSDYSAGNIPESVDRENTSYNVNSSDNVSLSSNSWRYVEEDEDSLKLDAEFYPVELLTISLGGLWRRAERTSEVQSYFENRSDTNPSGTTEAGEGISVGNFNGASRAIRGASDAEREIDASFVSLEYKPQDWLTLVGGYRLEASTITVDSQTLLDSASSLAGLFRDSDLARAQNPPTSNSIIRGTEAEILGIPDGFRNTVGDEITSELEDRIYLPAFTATIEPTDGVQFKLGYYETINRPSFREITSDIFVDIENGDSLAGNPFLKSSTATSYDFRVELYPAQLGFEIPLVGQLMAENDMFGLSLFYKDVEDPIEFIRPTYEAIDEIPFNNTEGATAQGVEFEISKSLSFIELPIIEDLSLGGNVSFTVAEAGVSEAEKNALSLNVNEDGSGLKSTRPLTEQPEQIINLNLTYQHPDLGTQVTLAYNKTSEVLESIGSQSSLDAYRDSVERVDLIASHEFENGWKLKFAVKNLLDEGYDTYFEARSSAGGDAADVVSRQSVSTVGRQYSISASRRF